MVQPKTPPLSIRPGEERLERIDAYAEKHGITRHAAVLAMLDAAAAPRSHTRQEIDRLYPPLVGCPMADKPKPWKGGHPKPTKGKK